MVAYLTHANDSRATNRARQKAHSQCAQTPWHCNLENAGTKDCDAGPTPQRVDPHLLTHSRTQLQQEGRILTRIGLQNREWHYLPETDPAVVEQRFQELQELHARTEARSFTMRMGQTAEIAVIKALQQSKSNFIGHFTDLELHDDSTMYMKNDPDFVSGIHIRGGRLDYILFHPEAGPMGLR